MGIADGVDEVHKATVARNVLKEYRPHEGFWPTEYLPAKRGTAWKKMQPVFDTNPELRQSAENYKKYLAPGAGKQQLWKARHPKPGATCGGAHSEAGCGGVTHRRLARQRSPPCPRSN